MNDTSTYTHYKLYIKGLDKVALNNVVLLNALERVNFKDLEQEVRQLIDTFLLEKYGGDLKGWEREKIECYLERIK